MSQAGIINTSSGPVPPTVPTSFVTDVNSPAVPAANVLDVLGGSTTANTTSGIRTDGSSGGNILTVQLSNRIQGTGTTVGATTADIATFSLGATPGAYNFELKVIAYNASSPAASGFTTIGTMRTNGVTATLVSIPDETFVEDVVLLTCDVDMVASGNNLIIRVTGVAGLTIDWLVVATYVFVS